MTELPKSFADLLATVDKPILVDFWAPWCGPCRAVSQAIEQVAGELSGKMLTIKINVDEKQDIARQYQISSIPTIMLFSQGQPVMRLLGAQPAAQIRREIEAHWPGG